MDFLDPKKRKAHRIKLFIGYALMALALFFATYYILNQVNGYNVDPLTGEVTQNGFVFVDASPVEARIILNGQNHGTTDERLDVASGDYSLELRADGFRSWSHDFTLEGGTIERLTYPFLFPNELTPNDIQLYANQPGIFSQSPDRKWLLMSQPGSVQRFDLLDTTVEAPTAITVTLPNNIIRTTGSVHTLTAEEWSSDNRHVLLKHKHDTGHEFVILDIESPGSSFNLSDTVSGSYTKIAFRDKKYDRYYLYNDADKTLKTADRDTPTPEDYLTNVLAFQPHGNDVMAYVSTSDAKEGYVWLKVREGSDSFNVRELPTGENYLVDIARFENSWYVAGGTSEDQKLYIFKNPVAAIKRKPERRPLPVAALRTTGKPEFLSFSANARFVMIQSGKEFAVYDAETDRQYRYDTGLQLEAGYEALWMDGHRISAVSNGKAYAFDFDGTNQQELSAALNNTPVYYSQGWEELLLLAPSTSVSGRLSVSSTSLRLPID